MPQNQPSKIAIVGAGAVGATVAYACMIRGLGQRIVLFDQNRAKVSAEALDLNHGLQFVPMASIEGSDDIQICADADIVIVTAGAKQKPGQTRLDLAAANAQICRAVIPRLAELAPEAILLMVTNPVDVITHVAQKLSGLPAARVFGSGTVLDSSRFRYLIAQRCKVAVQNVHAYVVGEHGDSEVPLWSTANIGGIPMHEWAVSGHGKLSVRDRAKIFDDVKNAAYQVIEGKGATNYAIGLSTAQIVEAILSNQNRVLPVSSLIAGHFGLTDVCLSLPAIVSRGGVGAVLDVRLNDAELAGLQNSAQRIKETLLSVGF